GRGRYRRPPSRLSRCRRAIHERAHTWRRQGRRLDATGPCFEAYIHGNRRSAVSARYAIARHSEASLRAEESQARLVREILRGALDATLTEAVFVGYEHPFH